MGRAPGADVVVAAFGACNSWQCRGDVAERPAGTRYRGVVSATWSFDEQPRTGDPLLPGASPAAIRGNLLIEDRHAFDSAYSKALSDAREQLDLTELLRCLEHWRRRALLQRDPEDFEVLVRRASERLTGEPVPADEPLAVTRRRVGM